MKKSWVGWLLVVLFSSVIVSGTVHAQENEMTEMRVSVELLENGTGIITEQRDIVLESGTELYIVINEEDGLEVLDFQVDGLREVEDWDSDLSREEKAGTYGVIQTREGVELVWGIEAYGEQSYTLSYTVANVVRQLNDGQALFWDFNTFGDLEPENLFIEIGGPQPFSEEDTRLYGFGYEGQVDLVDGVLRSTSEGGVEEDRPVAILMQFLNDPFIPSYYVDETLEEQIERAEAETSRGGEGTFDSSVLVTALAFIVAGFLAFVFALYKIDAKKKEQGKVPSAHAQRKRNKGLMFTAIPYKDGELTDIAFFLQQLQKGTYEQYIFAYLLKWSKEKLVSIQTEADESADAETTVLTFAPHTFRKKRENSLNTSHFELELWEIFMKAADDKNQLTNEEMTSWAEKNGKDLQALQQSLMDESQAVLVKEGYLKEKTLRFMTMKLPFLGITKKGQKLYDRLTQFENHINALKKDPSLSYRQLIEEKDFLIWASLYGKEEDLISQLEEVVPEWQTQEIDGLPYFYTGYYGLHMMSTSVHTGLSNGGYTHTSGTVGPTSIGGGGGAIGGGGGGVR
ncbi:Predicted membrane protein [Alkalibacterium subtropicum]|uniref:Predicted membrane protein n=1 Tax=Alkalibacterium subtropicum TaxID=753702 RepID=A0A1I1FEX4_9LACT|nr:DUF2207 domain-containing protein [Alkalibacterium subtropicum]SFB97532.1 Predicted membrane protein [Alkalibacterium subtropicum]